MQQNWAEETGVDPLGFIALFLMSVALLVVPRRYAALPLLIMAALLPSTQRVVVATLDFTLLRLLVLVGCLRIWWRGEARDLYLVSLDYAVAAWAVVATVTGALLGGSSTLVAQLGFGFDALGIYMLCRCWIRGFRDLERIGLGLGLMAVPMAIGFYFEHQTGHNFFSIFGGVREFTQERMGEFRCQGAFSHPIMAGCFWASMMPLVAARWVWPHTQKIFIVLACALILLVVRWTESSTPIVGVLAAGGAASLFFVRGLVRPMRWALAVSLVVLHFSMKAPVWHLISRIDLVGGSTGWHRYHLLDAAIRHFPDWWLVGTLTNAQWGWLTSDLTNQYVLEGVRGGLLRLILFIVVLSLAYQAVGRLCDEYRKHRPLQMLSWALGSVLFAHTVMFFAASYFGQTYIAWYLPLAAIGSLYAAVEQRKAEAARAVAPRRPDLRMVGATPGSAERIRNVTPLRPNRLARPIR